MYNLQVTCRVRMHQRMTPGNLAVLRSQLVSQRRVWCWSGSGHGSPAPPLRPTPAEHCSGNRREQTGKESESPFHNESKRNLTWCKVQTDIVTLTHTRPYVTWMYRTSHTDQERRMLDIRGALIPIPAGGELWKKQRGVHFGTEIH